MKRKYIATKLNRVAELWGKIETTNELGEFDYNPRKIKDLYVGIVPQTGNMAKAPADTIMAKITTKFTCRYQKGITEEMWLIYGGEQYDIKYIQDPYASHKVLEIFCEKVVE